MFRLGVIGKTTRHRVASTTYGCTGRPAALVTAGIWFDGRTASVIINELQTIEWRRKYVLGSSGEIR